MANSPSSVYWVGGNGHTYVKSANTPGGVQDYGVLSPDAKIANSTLINDPNPTPPPGSGNYDPNGTTTGTGATAADIAGYDQSINATKGQIGNLDIERNNLLAGAQNSYQTLLNNLNQSKAEADKSYKTDKAANGQSYNTNKDAIRTDTGNTITSIGRVIGSGGGAGQSAGDYAALLAGKAGSKQLGVAGTTFGKNEQSLDTGYDTFNRGYNTNLTNAGLQREADINSAESTIATKKANLLNGLAGIINQRTSATGGKSTAASDPYVSEANALLTRAATLAAPRPVAAQTPTTYTAPTLSSYTTNPSTVQPGGNAANESVLPFVSSLLNRKQLQAA